MRDRDFAENRTLEPMLKKAHLFPNTSAPWQQHILRTFINKYSLNGATCLDAACGIGNNIRTLLSYNMNIFAFDKSESAAQFARERYSQNVPEDRIKIGPLEYIPYEDGTFDFVICTEALEHVKDLNKVIQELHRVTKPNGYILLSFQNYLNLATIVKPISEWLSGKNWDAWGTHSHDEGFERHLNVVQVRRACRTIGLEVQEDLGADYINAWLSWFPPIRKNYAILDRYPMLTIGSIPVIKYFGMDYFVMLKK